MKRKITKLEQKLLDKGFVLECKTYKGKHSQFVNEYHYRGVMQFFVDEYDTNILDNVLVVLNSKKDHIVKVYIYNDLTYSKYLSKDTLRQKLIMITQFENEILRLESDEPDEE